MLLAEEELAVQVGEVDCVEVNLRSANVGGGMDDEDFLEVVETHCLEELAANASRANEQRTRVAERHSRRWWWW